MAERILGRTDVTLAGADSSGSMSTGWKDVTLACGTDHSMRNNFTVAPGLLDITLALLDASCPDERHQFLNVLLRFCPGLVTK